MTNELAWAIGLFEGEGTISDGQSKTRSYVYYRARVQLASTDEDVVRRFHAAVRLGNVNGPYNRGADKGHKPYWSWCASSHSDVAALLKEWLPMLGERRAKKAREVLSRL